MSGPVVFLPRSIHLLHSPSYSMFDAGSKKMHRRMIKVQRSPQDGASYGYSATQTPLAQTTATTNTQSVPTLPSRTAALTGVIAFLALALILCLGIYLYRRVRNRGKKSAPSSAFNFDRNAFSEKVPYSPSLASDEKSLPSPMSFILSASLNYPPPQTKKDENTTTVRPRWTPPKLRIRNDTNNSIILPSTPKGVAKNQPFKHFKSSWMNPMSRGPEDSLYMVGSPPPAYDAANAGESFVIPVPSNLRQEQTQATPTPPATQMLHTKPKRDVPDSLVSPTVDEPLPVASPARSESFAPKELVIPVPPASASSTLWSPSSTNSPQGDFGSYNLRAPRLMNVILPYTPTLPDELSVKVGDTIRLMQEYRDGWCFVQYVGKIDAPKGVIPRICLEERRRMVPVRHKTSNGSSISFVWR